MSDHPETLAKFCTAAAAHTILAHRSLRWSAPNLFNDPFEPDHCSGLNFDPHSMLDAVLRTSVAMIFSPDEPRGNSPLTMVIRRWRDEERFANPDEAEEVLRELMGRMVDLRQRDVDELMADWRRFTRQLRICCFGIKADNLASWQRFGDNHSGAVIRFDTDALSETAALHRVEYKSSRPEITTLKEQLNAVLYNERTEVQALFLEKFLVKSPVNSREQEWRGFYHAGNENSSKQHDAALWYDDLPFEPSAVTAIYLGASMQAGDKKALSDVIKNDYPHCKIFQTSLTPGKYEIEFSRLNPT